MCSDVANGEYDDIKCKNETTLSREDPVPEKDVVQNDCTIPYDQCPSKNGLKEDLMLEIVDLLPEEDIRLDNEEQATECSSSFSHSQSENEGQSCEVESELRDGNGAKPFVGEDGLPLRRKKRALNPEWKAYRQGIEWRCRWLELQVKQLKAQSNKYDRILEISRKRKEQYLYQQSDSVARTVALSRCSQRNHILRRRQRRKAEEHVDLKFYMTKHPVFSRYEKKRQRKQNVSGEEAIKDDNQQILEIEDLNVNFEDEYEDDFVLEEDSMEQYLLHIEELQMHVAQLRNQLFRGFRSSVSPNLSVLPSKNLPARSFPTSKATGNTAIARRRNSDFDINNVIMPDNAMANFIQPTKHVLIGTPHWRLLEKVPAAPDGGSSSEDTDDETYEKRHLEMQAKEEQQYAPVNKYKGTTASGKLNCKNISGKERPSGLPLGDVIEDFPDFPSTFVFIPKRKRRKRESRDIASITKNIEPLLNVPHTDSSEEQVDTMNDGNI